MGTTGTLTCSGLVSYFPKLRKGAGVELLLPQDSANAVFQDAVREHGAPFHWPTPVCARQFNAAHWIDQR